jgi:hypothetical protein
VRHTPDERLLIVANLGSQPAEFALGALGPVRSVLLSTHLDAQTRWTRSQLHLRPDEGVIMALEPNVEDRL